MANDKDAILAKLRVATQINSPNLIRSEQVVVKSGPKTYKTATLLYAGNKGTGEVKSVKLITRSYSKHPDGKYDFDNPDFNWYCEDSEISLVQQLLNSEFPDAGTYQLVTQDAGLSRIAQHIEDGDIKPDELEKLIKAFSSESARAALASSEAGQLMASAVQMQHQKDVLQTLRQLIEASDTTETQIQTALQGESWLFGGRFIGEARRRGLTVLDQLDIPLLRADGTLHVVEIKKANIPGIIRTHRNHLIAGADVHEAVSQGQNYLRSLDEQRATILTELGVDCRRASVTVVLGHPKFSAQSEEEITETLRTYNSHLSRVEVITYKELLDGAERSLALA